ncbi:unnamed protein product [Macrosiphum euphorbiae]|uniref:Uncharacterized protein n=1 Tax=Macrosiphum euphorbiae TaxID=13131 RepID=A0AAV0WTN4_9HEMI|nr:unnamed protein product [Macrosiphum euphorbiae]
MLRTYCHDKHTNWVKWIPNIEYWINHSHHQSTGYTPYQIMYGQEPDVRITSKIQFPDYDDVINNEPVVEIVRKKLRSKAESRNKTKDQLKKFRQYQVGQQVLMKEHKLSSAENNEIHKFFLLYKGPYTITEIYGNNTVMLEDQYERAIRCNMSNIKPYHTMVSPEDPSLCFPPDPGITSDQSFSHPN